MNENGINAIPPKDLVRQGWVDLPGFFSKYNYNNYFIKHIQWNFRDNVPASILRAFGPVIEALQGGERTAPNTATNYQVVENYSSFQDLAQNILNCEGVSPEDQGDCIMNQSGSDCTCLGIQKSEAMTEQRTLSGLFTQSQCSPECRSNTTCNQSFPDPTNYFLHGAYYPVKGAKSAFGDVKPSKYIKTDAPYCNYYEDRCRCNFQSKQPEQCCPYTVLDCSGNRCFTRWAFEDPYLESTYSFTGEAVPFVFSGDTGKVIPFPNPDISYLGCCTIYNPASVYVVWMDIPRTPLSPGFSHIAQSNSYDLRYISVGHYFYGMTPPNLRPVLSDLFDQFINTIAYDKIDPKTNEHVKRDRAVFVLASDEQYYYLTNNVGQNSMWNEKLNWLNWGKTKMKSKIHDIDDDHRPIYGIMLYRQLLPNQSFSKSLSNFSNSPCIKNTIKSSDIKYTQTSIGQQRNTEYANQNVKPPDIPMYCNPGDDKICKDLDLNPCCRCVDCLQFLGEYYPRCEVVNLCDIKDDKFWDKYFLSSFPTKYDAPASDTYPIPNLKTSVDTPYDFVKS